ncbi:MAG: phosphatidylglycerophosphatase A [Rubricella sp.]
MNAPLAIATVFGIGRLRPGPGTWGSLVALPLAWGLHTLGHFPLLLAATIVVWIVGQWAIARVSAGESDPDRSEFVVDEVVGQWIALWGLSAGLWISGQPSDVFPWPGVVSGFILFRLLDISKPWPVSVFDRMKTPAGVMLDDVVAGLIATAVTLLGAALAHGWFA